MAILQRIMASGASAGLANNIVGDFTGSLTASGTTKATALLLNSARNYVSVCSSGKAVALPATNINDEIEVWNGGSNTLTVFTNPSASETITNGSTLGGFSVATLRSAKFTKVTSTLFMVNYSA